MQEEQSDLSTSPRRSFEVKRKNSCSPRCSLEEPSTTKISTLATSEKVDNICDGNGHLMIDSVTWKDIPIPEDRLLCSEQLKFLIRRGIPDCLRSKIWKTVVGYNEKFKSDPTEYEQAKLRSFGAKEPNQILNVPLFGGEFHPEDYHLSDVGVECAKRVLCVIAMENTFIDYLPMLPDLVLILLHYMNETETYVTASLIIKNKDPSRYYFKKSLKGISLFLFSFDDLLKLHVPKLHAQMVLLGIDTRTFTDHWFLRIFVSVFPLSTVLRIFDAFLNEGSKILYRAALGFMRMHLHVLEKYTTAESFINAINQLASQCVDADKLMKKGFKIGLKWKHMEKFHQKNDSIVKTDKRKPMAVYYRPKIAKSSDIITDGQFDIVWSWLPHRYLIQDPDLVFNSKTDGFSLKHLLNKLGGATHSLLLFKTDKKDVFGAFIADPWKQDQKGFYGSNETFLWTFSPAPKKFAWKEGNPTKMKMFDSTGLSIGGGGSGVGLFIDHELHEGRTEMCGSLLNDPLTKDGRTKFNCISVEAYKFK